jgi:hypothetical protein
LPSNRDTRLLVSGKEVIARRYQCHCHENRGNRVPSHGLLQNRRQACMRDAIALNPAVWTNSQLRSLMRGNLQNDERELAKV